MVKADIKKFRRAHICSSYLKWNLTILTDNLEILILMSSFLWIWENTLRPLQLGGRKHHYSSPVADRPDKLHFQNMYRLATTSGLQLPWGMTFRETPEAEEDVWNKSGYNERGTGITPNILWSQMHACPAQKGLDIGHGAVVIPGHIHWGALQRQHPNWLKSNLSNGSFRIHR